MPPRRTPERGRSTNRCAPTRRAPVQASYVRWPLTEANRLDVQLVTWFFPEYTKQYLEEEQKRNPAAAGLAPMAMDLGLHDQQSRPRPAFAEWE